MKVPKLPVPPSVTIISTISTIAALKQCKTEKVEISVTAAVPAIAVRGSRLAGRTAATNELKGRNEHGNDTRTYAG